MKSFINKVSAIAFVFVAGITMNASAQSNASAAATATIVTPITIIKNVDMNFGNAAVQASTGGTVVMTSGGVRTVTSGVTLPVVTGTVTAASFDIAGQANYTYAITLPSAVIIADPAFNQMTVNAFTSSPSVIGTLSASGTGVVTVGATLNVNAAQPAGVYTSASPFSVTVNYN